MAAAEIAADATLWPPIAPHSHSIIFVHGNALKFQRIFSAYAQTPCARSVRNLRSWFQREISAIRDLLGFSDYRHRLVDFLKSIEQAAGAPHPEKYRQPLRRQVRVAAGMGSASFNRSFSMSRADSRTW